MYQYRLLIRFSTQRALFNRPVQEYIAAGLLLAFLLQLASSFLTSVFLSIDVKNQL